MRAIISSCCAKALEQEGWEHIPVLSVNFSGLEKENSVELTLPLGKKLLYAFLVRRCDHVAEESSETL